MTRSILALMLLVACSGEGEDPADGGADGGAGGGGGNPSTGQEYYTAIGYATCDLYIACTPVEQQSLSYEQCIANVDLAAQYYDMAFAGCTFDAELAQQCLETLESLDCDGEVEAQACSDEVWTCP